MAAAPPSDRGRPSPGVARPAPIPTSPAHRPIVEPLAPQRYRVQITIGAETEDKLRRLQDLLRREIPDGDPAAIFDRALTLLLADVEKKKLAATERPMTPRPLTPGSRTIPASVRRAVTDRDGGQCGFVTGDGYRLVLRSGDRYFPRYRVVTENLEAHRIYAVAACFAQKPSR